MTVQRFIAVSLIVHAMIVSCLFFIQQKKKEQKAKEYTANLVAPPEIQKPPTVQPPKVKRLPPPPPLRNFPKPAPKPPKMARRALPALPAKPEPLPPNIKPAPFPKAPELQGGGGGKGGGRTVPGQTPSNQPGYEENAKSGESVRKRGPERPGFSGKGNFLFDQDVTERIARRDKTAGGKPGDRDNPVTFDSKPYEYGPYMELLRRKIESIWIYPPDAAARNIFGDLKIQFTIKRDGKLGEVKLVRTSGYKMLDDAAIKALKDGEPYWPLPSEWHKDSYTILGHFVYSLFGQQLN